MSEVAGGLPSSVHTEVAVLGAMLLYPDARADGLRLLDADVFSLDSHRLIFRAILSLSEDGDHIDSATVKEQLSKRRELDTVGGYAYILHLEDGIPRGFNVQAYCRILKDKSLLRQLISLFHAGEIQASDQSEEAIQVLQDFKERFAELEQGAFRGNRNRNILVGADDFMRDTPEATEWAVEGLIQRGGNGIIVGDPKSAKSFSTLDLAHHLVAGVDWLGHKIPRKMKVAYIAREDHAGLTQHRGLSLLKGYAGADVGWALGDIKLNEWLYYNTRAQSDTFSLQNQQDVQEIIEAFQDKGIEIAFFDVFRRLWEGDENDNKETAKILAVLTKIGQECKCAVGLVHHVNKSGVGTIFQRIRGSGTHGWAEWAFGVSVENPDDQPRDRVRKIEFQTKAGMESEPVYWCFDGDDDKVILATCAAPAVSYRKSSKGKGGRQKQDVIPWYAEDK